MIILGKKITPLIPKWVKYLFFIFVIFPFIFIASLIFYVFAFPEPAMEYMGSANSSKKLVSGYFDIPEDRIIYAIEWGIFSEHLYSFIVDTTGSDYKNFIPKDIIKLQTNASLVNAKRLGNLSNSQSLICVNDPDKILKDDKQYIVLTKTLQEIVCAEEYPKDTLFYQDYIESSQASGTSTTYVVFPRNNLIWISRDSW
jgi:hypothetical protein